MPDLVGGSVVWDLKVNSDKFKRNLDNAKSSVDNIGKSFKKQEKQANRLGKSIKNLAIGYLSFRALSGTIRLLGNLTKQFEAEDQAIARLNASLKNVAGSTQDHVKELVDQAAALQKVTTFGDEQVISAQALLGTFQQNSEAIKTLTPRILDMAASLEKTTGAQQDVEAITLAVGKAMTLGVGSLSRYGVVISDSAKKAFELADEQEKVSIISQELDNNFKGIAEGSAKTMTGQMRQLANQFGDFQEVIGGVAQFVKLQLVNAFIQGSGGMEAWGDNALKISKQVGEAFLTMGQAVVRVMQTISSLANVGKIAVQGGRQSISGVSGFIARQLEGQRGPDAERIRDFFKAQQLSNEEFNESVDITNEAIDSQSRFNRQMEEARNALEESKTTLEGITSVTDLMTLSAAGSADGFKALGAAGKKASEGVSEAAKKEAEELEKAKEKVIDFRQKEIDMSERVRNALKQEKLRIQDLKEEYNKAISAIKRNLDDLQASFDRSESRARGSFLSQLSSAADTARQTIADREELIQTELNKGEQADQSKIASLRALNAKERQILQRNAGVIAEADKIEAEKRTAVGVQNLIERFSREREEAKKAFERDKSDLNQQLSDREQQYAQSSLKVKQDTIETIADIRSGYIRMFDDLHRELKKLGEQFVNLMKIGVVGAPGASSNAQAAFANLVRGIPRRQAGGPVSANRPYLVGERGPEVVIPRTAGNVQPGVGGTFNFFVNEKVDMGFVLEEVKRELGVDGLQANFGINR